VNCDVQYNNTYASIRMIVNDSHLVHTINCYGSLNPDRTYVLTLYREKDALLVIVVLFFILDN